MAFCTGVGVVAQVEWENGDHGQGSRLYFRWPDGPLNQFGAPLDTCNASRFPGRGWRVAYSPKETVRIGLIGGRGAGATAASIALLNTAILKRVDE